MKFKVHYDTDTGDLIESRAKIIEADTPDEAGDAVRKTALRGEKIYIRKVKVAR